MRINTLKIGIDECQKILVEFNFTVDKHIPYLLSFEPETKFESNELYANGKIILQDKASCFPAHVLQPTLNCHVIDCCAAPGNKTSQLSMLMQNTGKVFAFDLDPSRLDILKKLTEKAGCKNIEAKCLDFLQVSPLDPNYSQVEYVLVDPSCSGSGMLDRHDEQDEISQERLKRLSKFQLAVILHAMQFPRAKRVVYSTCSVHEEENEMVVAKVLNSNPNFALAPAMPEWPHRGLDSYAECKFHSLFFR